MDLDVLHLTLGPPRLSLATMLNLPPTLADFLAAAYADMKALEATGRYQISLGDWHQPRGDVCMVCLAGSQIASQLGAAPDQELSDEDFPPPVQKALQALDLLTRGTVGRAATRYRDALKPQRIKYDVQPAMALRSTPWLDVPDPGERDKRIEQTIALLREAGI